MVGTAIIFPLERLNAYRSHSIRASIAKECFKIILTKSLKSRWRGPVGKSLRFEMELLGEIPLSNVPRTRIPWHPARMNPESGLAASITNELYL